MLYLKCDGQVVKIVEDERLADKYINANTVHWEFCERWDGMTITAQFTQKQRNEETDKDEDKTYSVLVDEVTNTVTLPNEITAGDVYISAFGVHPITGVRITTIPVKKTVDKSGFVGDGETPIPPTPDLYAQLLEKVNKTAIPHIGANGNWWFDDYDSGVAATAEIETAKQAAVNEINKLAANQQVAIENKAENALASIPEDYTTLSNDVSQLKDAKADAITDTSARAASHGLYAQRGRLGVTLYGATTETGTGDKSPENPYEIGGVGAARVHCGGKNLIARPYNAGDSKVTNGVTYTVESDGRVTVTGIPTNTTIFSLKSPVYLPKGQYTVSGCPVSPGATSWRITIYLKAADGTQIKSYSDYGSGVAFEVPYVGCYLDIILYTGVNVVDTEINLTFAPQLETGSAATAYEPYTANTADLPLLPDGSPLMGNGTVDDTVENDCASGCDCKITFADNADLTLPKFDAAANVVYSDTTAGIVVTNGVITSTLTYPCTVFYRSTEYTPDKDLRVCKTVRRWESFTLDGNSTLQADTERPGVYLFFMSGYDANVLPIVDGLTVKNPTTSNNGANNMNANECAFRIGTTDRFYIKMAEQTVDEVLAVFAANPVTVWYALSTEQTYMTDPIPLRKPDTLETDTVTVTGSGETEVEYAHDTKHYIDSKISELVTLALASN